MRTGTYAFVLLVGLVACRDAKTKKCEEVRDRYMDHAEERLQAALKEIPAERRDEALKQNHKEEAQFKERFVDLCRKTENLDFACFTGPGNDSKATPACRDMLDPIWKQVYGD
jgi:hypothetical protein